MDNSEKAALLQVARDAISARFEQREPNVEAISHLTELLGVFVTLTIEGQLRGCIGYPLPELPLNEALVLAAQDAAFRDPRFMPLSNADLEIVDLEINVLTSPELIEVDDPDEYLDRITVGVDGLLIRGSFHSGLLLPSVAERLSWSTEEYLRGICEKAGLEPQAWRDQPNELYKFQSEEFSEADFT